MSVLNVVQHGAHNVACLGLPGAAGTDSSGGEKSQTAAGPASGPAAAWIAAEDDQAAGSAGAVCHAAADAQSAVFVPICEGEHQPCHIPCHNDGQETGPQAGARTRARAAQTRGGGGARARARASYMIGLHPAENFHNGSPLPDDGRPQKKGAAHSTVEAVRPYGRKAIFARVVRTGQIVLVQLGRGLHAERFTYPCWLHAEQEGGAWIYRGQVPRANCPQCLLPTPVDCDEQPCGWQKKEGGAA